ncbi:hypothetical protein G6F31_017047 [Rhizopus arrhizus]|nr:hypothetical protein G6F31_017047 [Rhizopus arrhizus]
MPEMMRVAGGDVLDADRRGNVAGVDLGDLAPLVGVHLQDAAQPFLLALDRVEDRIARLHHAGVNAEEHQLPDEGVRHDLEGQRRERLVQKQHFGAGGQRAHDGGRLLLATRQFIGVAFQVELDVE